MSVVKCDHCALEFDEKVMIKDGEHFFCCNGCQGVYHLLKNDGLDSFYEKKGSNTLEQPIAVGEDSSNFDLESFAARYIKTTTEGFSSVDLIIEGIHCAACIWLNEKVLDSTDGIVEAKINFTNNKAKIVWDEDIIKLSQIIDKIRSIGYNAYPYERSATDKKVTKTNRDYFLRMSVAIFASMNIMMIGVAKYSGFFTGMSQSTLHLVHIAEFIFATPVLFYSGWIFYKGAYFGLKNKIINMDFLVSSGATLTYIYSLYILFGGVGHSYFDSVSMIITFVLVGKYLEVIGKKSAVDTMDKLKMQIPLEATIIKDDGKVTVALDQIVVGDIVELKAGEKASVDGEIISGDSSFDESSLSGESIPVAKQVGDMVYSGTINITNVIRYKAVKNYANSTLNTIVELLEDSLNSKPKIEDTTNELSKYFSITILTLAFLSFMGWYFYDHNFEQALIIGISVIVIACPCALALATPIASLVGISWLTKEGLLFKEAKFIEVFAKATTVVFDKTGTLTKGKFSVFNIDIINKTLTKDEVNILYTLVNSSNHPVSIGVKNYLLAHYKNLEEYTLEDIKQIPAVGMEAVYKKDKIFGGKANLSTKYTTYKFEINGNLIVQFELQDSLKDDAINTINYLKEQGLELIICSGDNQSTVKNIASQLGIEHFKHSMTPKTKAEFISELKNQDKTIVMVGDGINDALALSRSDISIAMGNGADIAIAVSDVVVLNDKLSGLEKSFYISKRTYKFIKQNLLISLIYNTITIPVAMMGYVIPLVAALSMSVSSLLVVGNSMRINNKKYKDKNG